MMGEIRKKYKDRLVKMISLLEDKEKKLTPERQHQLYGAINEIKTFLETLDHYRVQEVNDELKDFSFESYGNPEQKKLLKKFAEKIKSFSARLIGNKDKSSERMPPRYNSYRLDNKYNNGMNNMNKVK